jgi:hypothetical protein
VIFITPQVEALHVRSRVWARVVETPQEVIRVI